MSIANLPIHQIIAPLIDTLSNSQNVVLQADPGAGKSTVVPMELLKASYLKDQMIVMLEPRRMAARAIASFLSKQLNEVVGETVGYQIKNEKKLSSDTRLLIVTEGILLKKLQSDPELEGIGLVIFDEFHERSINADLTLMLALEAQQILREDLKLLVMSATLDTETISKYLDNAPILKCPGRVFPVSVSYQKNDNINLSSNVVNALHGIIKNEGDVLVFLPGVSDIKKCLNLAKETFAEIDNLQLFALYGAMPIEEQEKAIQPSPTSKKKVVFTTNIAETSLTIEGVKHVIDSGLEKKLVFDPSSGMSKLSTVKISKASAEQRKGRAGRLSEGNCIRLWKEEAHRQLKDFQEEEVLSADLSAAVLELANAGNYQYENINWLTAPPKANFESTQALLADLELLNSEGKMTSLGKEAGKLSVHPRLAKMLLAANSAQEKEIAVCLSALLSERDILKTDESADISLRLLALIDAIGGKSVEKSNLNRNALKSVLRDYKTIKQNLGFKSNTTKLKNLPDIAAYLLLLAFPDRLAQRRSQSDYRYKLANGRGVALFESDPLCSNEYLIVTDCDADKKEGRIYSAIACNRNILSERFSDQIIQETDYELVTSSKKLYAYNLTKYKSLILNQTKTNDVPKELLLDCVQKLIMSNHRDILNWTKDCENWLSRVEWLGQNVESFPKLSIKSVMAQTDTWLLPYVSNIKDISELKHVDLLPLLQSLLTYEETKTLTTEAPSFYITPSRKKVAINYCQNQGPTVSVVLQEVLGEKHSPLLAQSSVPLRFELLSPAKRPIQITSDLAQFWLGSYHEVAKDMRAKYPKHRWPEDPFSEQAGSSIKKKPQR